MGELFYSFNEGSKSMKSLLGDKGANLSEMTGLGLPVPFGFVVSTKACAKFFEEGHISPEMAMAINEKIGELEEVTEKKFGSGDNPLLVSVRTSSAVSIPTMAETILNLGLNDKTVEGLAKIYGSMEFALDSYSRFIRMYGTIVRHIPKDTFINAYEKLKARAEARGNAREEEILFDTVEEYKRITMTKSGAPFPQDPYEQLYEAIGAMLGYWNLAATVTYRELHEIEGDIGVALVVQTMVFGNLSENSCVGTVFTRDPKTGQKVASGKFMIKAQAGDLAFSDATILSIEKLEEVFPDLYKQFKTISALLENHFKDMQEIEFAVERGKLYMLQAKKGRRSPEAAVRIAVEMVKEEIIDKKTAVASISTEDIDQLTLSAFGESRTIGEATAENFATVLDWADDLRTMGVRANIDTPEDAMMALTLGAEGIGLCRSEHMFFEEDRIYDFITMLLADTKRERSKSLEKLLAYQQEDFKRIFEIMEEKPVTIRLLDPSLETLIPKNSQDMEKLAERLGISMRRLGTKLMLLREENPTIGTRGSRIAVAYPEVARMQTTAIVKAAIEARKETGTEPNVSIMVPFVSTAREFDNVKATIRAAADTYLKESEEEFDFFIGTMIETPRAALLADSIASRADFFSFGTNDLTEMVYGFSKEDTEELIEDYIQKDILDRNPFLALDLRGVGKLIAMAVREGRRVKPRMRMGLCGEHGSTLATIRFCSKIDINFVSCSTLRIPGARIAAAQAAIMMQAEQS